ncbi:unnamed protein product, partial [Discosporangium mesarthrocarpum]
MSGRGRARGGKSGRGRGGGGSSSRSRDVCVCPANEPALRALRELDSECLRMGKQNLRYGVLRAIKSVQRYPLPITTEAEACSLEGVGAFTARRMLQGMTGGSGVMIRALPGGRVPGDEGVEEIENIPPIGIRGQGLQRPLQSAAKACGVRGLIPRSSLPLSTSLARNILALTSEEDYVGDDGCGGDMPQETDDHTPRRPKTRARTGSIRHEAEEECAAPPRVFAGSWEAVLLLDNREYNCMSVQSALLQKGVACETRQLPLGDMIWVARRKDAQAPEVLLGYIVERKTASDLASSIVDGRYTEQKRRLRLSGLERLIYLVEGSLSHQSHMPPTALRTALAVTQAVGGFAVVRCGSPRDTVDFLARTHRHIASLLHTPTLRGIPRGAGAGTGAGEGILRPGMTYGDYSRRCAKNAGTTTVGHVLGSMLRQVKGCSAGRAEAIVREFGSPLGLMVGLEKAIMGHGGEGGGNEGGDEGESRGEVLLGGVRCRRGTGTNKLPQPLRRLLCRVFLED